MRALDIRSAAWGDLPAIAAIYNAAIAERIATCDLSPRSAEERAAWFGRFDDRHPVWVGTRDDTVVAYGCLHPYSPKEGYRFAVEHSVYVARNARGAGFGRQMLEHLIDQARRLGYHYMEGLIFAHNGTSLKLHADLGFERMGVKREVANLDGRWVDVVVMAKLL